MLRYLHGLRRNAVAFWVTTYRRNRENCSAPRRQGTTLVAKSRCTRTIQGAECYRGSSQYQTGTYLEDDRWQEVRRGAPGRRRRCRAPPVTSAFARRISKWFPWALSRNGRFRDWEFRPKFRNRMATLGAFFYEPLLNGIPRVVVVFGS